MIKRTQPTVLTLKQAIQSFIGFLEGTQKANHTIQSYRIDLQAFEKFIMDASLNSKPLVTHLTTQLITEYRNSLEKKGDQSNTKRRKILTVSQFCHYLVKRKKLTSEFPIQFPVPHKVERIPKIVSVENLFLKITQLPNDEWILCRNKVLLWTLIETGCLVNEVCQLRFENWKEDQEKKQYFVNFQTKNPRVLLITKELYESVQLLKNYVKGVKPDYLFSGFNKLDSLKNKITQRSVELIIKQYRTLLDVQDLTPRMLRHSVILSWFEKGWNEKEIQYRLGLRSTYAFRTYSLLKSTPTTNKFEVF